VADLEPLLRFWRALDARFERVEPAWWGAVVTDSRFPAIWDVNYARIETEDPALSLAEVETALLPELQRAGCRNLHTVVFHPEELTGLVAEASSRGDRLTWDEVMVHRGDPSEPMTAVEVEEVGTFDGSFWSRYRESLREFGISEEVAIEQLTEIERQVLIPAGKRWFAVRDEDRAVSLGSLIALEGVGYIDHVVTFPEARRRGHARAITRRMMGESRAADQDPLYLLVEPDSGARSVYERLGFETITHIASTLRPLP
jgi:ribosomal protein S18 acetylase RimI-like enzyme